MPDLDDAGLELRLRRVLSDRLDPLTLSVSAHELEQRRVARDRTRRRRQVLVALGLAAALVVPVGWLVAGAPVPTVPLPAVIIATPGPTNRPMPTPKPAVAATTTSGGYQAVVIRTGAGSGFDVIAVRADGQERVLAQIASASMPAGLVVEDALVGGSGWLAVVVGYDTDIRLVLVDLRHPAAPTRTLVGDYSGPGFAWGPDGRLAIQGHTEPGKEPPGIVVIDPATGESIQLTPAAPLSGQVLAWAADGSGLEAETSNTRRPVPGQPADWQRQLVPSGILAPGFVPLHDAGRGFRPSIAGDRLLPCIARRRFNGCPNTYGFEVGRVDVAGAVTFWDVAPRSGGVDDAAFAASDRGIWVLRRDPVAGLLGLDRLDDRGDAVRGVTAPLPAGLTPDAASRTIDWMSNTQIEAMAPDDSLALITMTNDDPDITEWFLLPTDGLPGTYHEGAFVGYLASSVADTIGTDAFRPVAGAEKAEEGHAPDLPSNEQIDGYAHKEFGVSATDAVLRAAWLRGQPPTELGTVRLPAGHRLAVYFACSGPRTADIAYRDATIANGNLTTTSRCMADDQSGYAFVIEATSTDRLLPISVAVEDRASWRLVVFDLGP